MHKGRHGSDPLALDPETMRELGYRTIDLLVERLQREEPPIRRASPAEMQQRLRPARTDGRLYALGKARFLASVGSHPRATRAGDRLVHERLPAPQATIAP